MAGVGAYPPVVYLEKDTRWGDLGAGLGKLAGGIFDAWNTRDTMEKAQRIPDLSQRMLYVQSRMGEKGGQMVAQQQDILKSQADISRSQAETDRARAEIHSSAIIDQLNSIKVKNQDAMDRSEINLRAAEAARARAGAAGEVSTAALRTQEIAKIRQDMEVQRQTQDRLNQGAAAFSDFLRRRQQAAPPAGDESGTTPKVTPESYVVPDTGNGDQPPVAKPITADQIQAPVLRTTGPAGTAQDIVAPTGGAGGTPEKPSDTPGFDARKTVSALRLLGQGRNPAAGLDPPPTSDTTMMRAAAAMAKGDLEGAAKAVQEGDIPSKTEMRELIPGSGIKVEYGLYSDGRYHVVPNGNFEGPQKPAGETTQRVATGASLWDNTAQLLKQLNTMADPGNAAVRWVNQIRRRAGMGAMGDEETAKVRTDYGSVYEHAIIGITSLMLGTRPTQESRRQMEATLPAPTDSPQLRQSKLRATELTADLLIKDATENAMAAGEKVPPALMRIYMQRGLMDKDERNMRAEYLERYKTLGVEAPDLSDTTDVTGGGASAPAKAGTGPGEGGGWIITPRD